jgi:hypothetical protein
MPRTPDGRNYPPSAKLPEYVLQLGEFDRRKYHIASTLFGQFGRLAQREGDDGQAEG